MVQEDMPDTPGIDLGALATSFLHRFGHAFDYSECAVSVRRGGVVPADAIGAAAHARGPGGAGKGPRIAIEDPQVRPLPSACITAFRYTWPPFAQPGI